MLALLSNRISTKSRGFSLIELLIVMAIIGILASIGIYASVQYGNAQKVEISARNFANMLQSAKSRAFSQVVPPTCVGLLRYEVALLSTSTHRLQAVCTTGGTITVGKTVTLPTGSGAITYSPIAPSPLQFPVQTGRVANLGVVSRIYTFTGSGVSKTVTLYEDARVSIQ